MDATGLLEYLNLGAFKVKEALIQFVSHQAGTKAMFGVKAVSVAEQVMQKRECLYNLQISAHSFANSEPKTLDTCPVTNSVYACPVQQKVGLCISDVVAIIVRSVDIMQLLLTHELVTVEAESSMYFVVMWLSCANFS